MLAALFATVLMHPQAPWPQTRAEQTEYRETSRYEDVIAFLEALDKKGAPIRVTFMGESTEGRKVPLVIAARPMVSTPKEAHQAGKAVVYVQANIHAGEVEGKEAALMLLRRVSQDPHGLLDRLVLVVAPIYNADGNEKFGPASRNRPGQNGPDEVGVRTNGQGFDLNRDCMKAESPEMRGVLEHVYGRWNPDAMMDLHTTNGTRHGYGLTYSPPLNPNTDPDVLAYSRDQLLPDVRRELRDQYKLETFDYGNTARRTEGQAWLTFGEEPRYVTNYAGVRGRIGVLSEAVTYLPFDERVRDTDRFVAAVLGRIARDADKVVAMAKAADARAQGWGRDPSSAPPLGVRFEMDRRGSETVLLEKPAAEGAPRRTGKPTEFVEVAMPVFDRFKATRTSRLPAAYLIPPSEKEIADLLRRHGVAMTKLEKPWKGQADRFHIRERNQDANPFQGHRLIRLEGAFEREESEFAAGSYLVRTDTPLAVLVFHLLEPESLDGAAAWGFFGDTLSEGTVYPIAKLGERPQS